MIKRLFRNNALTESHRKRIEESARTALGFPVRVIGGERCFYVVLSELLSIAEAQRLHWLLAETYQQDQAGAGSFLAGAPSVLEIGPRLNFETAWSTQAVGICHGCGLTMVYRMERSLRISFDRSLSRDQLHAIAAPLHDRMTQMVYDHPLESFEVHAQPHPMQIVPLLEEGVAALKRFNREMGLGMDEQDLQYNYDLFVNILHRNPTDVEPFQLGQANSEHSRHPLFKGKYRIDGKECPESLMEIVQTPWKKRPGNSLLAFCDDSSAIRSLGSVPVLIPEDVSAPSSFLERRVLYHPTLTAETHNFPTGVAPFAGAETGTGGRIRDNQAVGRGGQVIAAGAAYCVGNLHIPGYVLPWEEDGWQHPANLASPLDILIQASNGASDYGNKFGEPVIYGFTRTFGMMVGGEYRSWFKPIMYTVGAGQVADENLEKELAEKGMLVIQIGGLAHRIGIGGGSASSMTQGENIVERDFDAVQRGDAQMEQRGHRAIQAFADLGDDNPIISIHDLGAGGDCNAVPEIVEHAGAQIRLSAIPVGDKTLSALEIWGNESQERWVLLARPHRLPLLQKIAEREGVPLAVIGTVTGNGQFTLVDGTRSIVDLPLDKVLGELPRKTFVDNRVAVEYRPLELPDGLTVASALERVLRLPSVCSKRYLTTKVDRSVTGLVAQQQCVGPNHITLSDYAVIAQSYDSLQGVALSLGEQPVKGLLSPQRMARLAVAEALLNLAGAKITRRQDIKCEGNWMLAAKFPGQLAWLFDAACAVRDIMIELGIAIDGGKDSLSMAAAKVLGPDRREHVVKAPGQLVIAPYAPMPDITCKITAEFKHLGSDILFVDLGSGFQLGGSALAQVFGQVGNDCPDLASTELLGRTFDLAQELVERELVSAVHDRSDGGLAVAVLEMAFAGNLGCAVDLDNTASAIEILFTEGPGLVLESPCADEVMKIASEYKVPIQQIGQVCAENHVAFSHNGTVVLSDRMTYFRTAWEETSAKLDELQANPDCVAEEAWVNAELLTPPPYRLTFDPAPTPAKLIAVTNKPKVAVIREQGTNGDQEMVAVLHAAGFEVTDVAMTDLCSGRTTLDRFRGVVFPGGFAHADVLNAGKGWAGVIKFNERVSAEFKKFYERTDTFSLGVCNGSQLMALLGWVPWELPDAQKPRFIRNRSERFESRFPTVRIYPSPSIFLTGMEESVLGVWVAHGEGRLHASRELVKQLLDQNLAPIRYVDREAQPTMLYPWNPSGTAEGIAGICSPDGRHLALMPHPERTWKTWHWPWMPEGWQKLPASPWLQMFQNAYAWCTRTDA